MTNTKKLDRKALNPLDRPIVNAIITAYEKALKRGDDTLYWAWDVHDTIMESTYSPGDIPRSMFPFAPGCMQKISRRKDSRLIMYTSSKEEHVVEYQTFFLTNNIKFDWVNENPAEQSTPYASFDKKMYFSIVCDDKAGFDPTIDFQAISDVLDHLPELTGQTKVFDIAATVARIHSPTGPTAGHDALIVELFKRGKKVLIFLSIDFIPSARNPLNFEDRKYLIECAIERLGFKNRDYSIIPLPNREDNDHWSAVLDQQIVMHAQKPNASEQNIALFHSRDGFGKHYEPYGRFPVLYVTEIKNTSATDAREKIKLMRFTNTDAFYGKIYQQFNQPNLLLNQVRVIRRTMSGDYLLVKYKGDVKSAYRFLGGYFNPEKDKSLPECLHRKMNEKVVEEAAVPHEFKLVGIVPVKDWRYREAGASIQCVVFEIEHPFTENQLRKNDAYRKLPAIEALCAVPKEKLKELLHAEEHPILDLL